MIDSIQLENYRCFEKTKIHIKSTAIFVGKNNAGKSSIIEALRLVALAIRKSTKSVYKELPREFGIALRERGFRLEVEKLKIDLRGVVYLYEDKIAKITTLLDSGNKIIIYLNQESAYACIYDINGKNVYTKAKARDCSIENVEILPPLGLIKESEKKLAEETIKSDMDSYLFSRHFRNEIYLYKDVYWKEFVNLAESTWKELKIKEILYNYYDDNYIKLFISDSRFLAELGLMGSGLQMWLQIMWFLCRSKDAETVILDEPDVYMHPDLQRKLVRLIRGRYKQIIIATHSVEIISEVECSDIVIVDKKKRNLSYAANMRAVQSIIDNLGSISNLSLTRLGIQRKCIFIEGKDMTILSKIQDILHPDAEEPISVIPSVALGGFNNLREAFGASKLFYDETRNEIRCFCILDSDYFPTELLEAKMKLAEENHLLLHIWKRKEIENYLIIPKVIFRLTNQKEDMYSTFLLEFEKILDEFEDDVFDQYSSSIVKYNKNIDPSSANKMARQYILEHWTSLDSKIELVGGKAFLKRMNKWIRQKYGVQCSIAKIINATTLEDIDSEVKEVIEILMDR
ncbi:MAG: ATP-binding protein [Clostridium sp.]|nr:ATP-binding protein [Clostridium sp.]